MKKIFIAYADDAMAWSLKRIGRQAKRIGVFDEIILYTPASLPEDVRTHPLMSHKRGAGLWYWKPNVIVKTLQDYPDAYVCYCDAGCTLRKSFAWDMMFRALEEYETILFRYEKHQPQWGKLGSSTSEIVNWTKKDMLDFLNTYLKDTNYCKNNLLLAGLLFIRNPYNSLLNDWLSIMKNSPDLIVDPTDEEIIFQHEGYAGHRHDQSLISALAPYYPGTLILPECSEKYSPDAFVYASRVRAQNALQGYATLMKHYFRRILGDKYFEAVKSFFFKRYNS